MKERLNSLLAEVGESFDYLRSDVRNLGRYLAELEELASQCNSNEKRHVSADREKHENERE